MANDSLTNRVASTVSQQLKVLLLSVEYTPEISGGVGTHVLELAEGLGELNHHVTVIALSSKEQTVQHQGNITIHFISFDSVSSTHVIRRSMVKGILAFNKKIVAYGQNLIAKEGYQPDIIHYYNWLTFSAARELSQQFNIPLVGRISYLSEPTERWWGQEPDQEIIQQEKALFSEAKHLIAVSHSLKKLIQQTYQFPPEKVHVIHNGLNFHKFIGNGLKATDITRLRKTMAQEDEKIVLFAGRLNPMKGITALLESAARVINNDTNARYLIVGEPDSRNYLKVIRRILEKYGLDHKVKLLGKIPRKQLAILYQAADLFVMPSIYEPFGWVAIEAMAAQLPVVATDVGGPSEIVIHEQTGLLVPVHKDTSHKHHHKVDIDTLTEAQIRLLQNELLSKALGKKGQQRVINDFSLKNMLQSTLDVYCHVLQQF